MTVDGKKNEKNGFDLCVNDLGFRNLLLTDLTLQVNRDAMKQYFSDNNITFDTDDQLEAVIDQINAIDWSEMQTLENLLFGRAFDILTG
jgi:hypothetical protein